MLENLVLAAIALLLVILVIFLLFSRQQSKPDTSLDLKSLFAEKLQLLNDARRQGELSEADFDLAAAELKAQTLAQLPLDTQLTAGNRYHLGIALGLIVVVSAGLYGWKGQHQQLADWELAQQQLQQYGERALLGKGEPLSAEETRLFALGLRTKLAQSGDDAMAWFMLGRIWFSEGLVDDALDAFKKALALTPERPNVLLSYAQALLVRGSEEDMQTAAKSLGAVLSKDPTNVDALAMLALIAQQRGDTEEAKTAWQLLAQQLPKEDPRRAMIEQQLQALEKPVAEVALVPAVRVKLTIPAPVAQLYPNATLFVFAKAVKGPPMPLAVVRMPVFAGEQTIELTNQMRMTPEFGLAEAGEVTIGARLSRTGSSNPDPADPNVQSAPVSLNNDWAEVSLSF